MALDPPCPAVAAAKARKGWSYGQIANAMGKPEQRIVDICVGRVPPTVDEFNTLANVLEITTPAPHNATHLFR